MKKTIQKLRPFSSDIKIIYAITTIGNPMRDKVFIPTHKFEQVDFEEMGNLANTYDPSQLPTYSLGKN